MSLMQPNIRPIIFFNFDCQKTLIWEGFWVEGGYGLLSEETEALHAKLSKRPETASSSYSAAVNFLQYIYSVLVAKNHYKVRSKRLVHEFSFKYIFNNINHEYSAAILKKSSLWSFRLIWLWPLIAIIKRRAERCTLQLYCI